jgi:hypothetical protein
LVVGVAAVGLGDDAPITSAVSSVTLAVSHLLRAWGPGTGSPGRSGSVRMSAGVRITGVRS